jgi:hypothetical protein
MMMGAAVKEAHENATTRLERQRNKARKNIAFS